MLLPPPLTIALYPPYILWVPVIAVPTALFAGIPRMVYVNVNRSTTLTKNVPLYKSTSPAFGPVTPAITTSSLSTNPCSDELLAVAVVPEKVIAFILTTFSPPAKMLFD